MRHVSCFAIAVTCLLSGCGNQAGLDRLPSMAPQPVAYGAQEAESASDLIEPSTQAVPERSSDLLYAAGEREYDPFDVPPGVKGIPFPGDPVTADFDAEGEPQRTERGDDGA